jgi:hypothetical protein
LAIALDEQTAAWVRTKAAERNITLSRFVGAIIHDEMQRSDNYQKAMRAALAVKPLEGLKILSREELYAERLRRKR